MLQAIRETVTGWIAYGIIFLISIPFALWGVNSYFGGGEAPPAATVNGEEITLQTLDQAYANYRQRLSQLFGGSIPDSFGGEEVLRQQVLDQLVEEFALRQYTEKQRYRIGDAELNRIIRGMDVFHTDGQFDTSIYQAQLRSLGYSPLGFEQELRRNRSMEQFQEGIRATAFVTPAAKKMWVNLSNQTRNLRTLTHRIDASAITPSEAEVLDRYEANAQLYRSEEQIKIDYIELSLDSVKDAIVVDPDDVRARYDENISAYTAPEVREASHILIKVGSDEDSTAALGRINDLRSRIVNGAEFAEIAREYSEDPGSAGDGGNLGEVERGVMVQTFEAALFALEVDQLSEPVKTAFGWHLIKLHSASGGGTRPFDEIRPELEDEIKTELAEGQIYDLVENLANLAYEQADSLLPAAEQLDLPLQTSDWFGRFSGTGIAAEQRVRQQAFAADVMQQGLNSEAIELGSDRIVFLRLNERKPPQKLPLDAVRDRIASELVQLQVRQRNEQAGKSGLEQLRDGKSLEDLAQEWGSDINDLGFVARGQEGVDGALLERAFAMPKPQDGTRFQGFVDARGSYIVIELSAILSSDAEPDQSGFERHVEARAGSDYLAASKLLTSRAKVVRTPLDEL